MASLNFKDRIDRLSSAINRETKNVSIKDQCMPTMVGIGIVVPFASMLVLFLARPSFVKKYEGNRSSISIKKLFIYTILSTLIIWASMYVFNMYKGFDKLAMMCVV